MTITDSRIYTAHYCRCDHPMAYENAYCGLLALNSYRDHNGSVRWECPSCKRGECTPSRF